MKETDKQDKDSAESARRFRTLFEQAPFSVQLFDREGRTLQVNKAWQALWNVREDDGSLDFVLNEYDILHDPQLEAKGFAPYLRRALAGESVTAPPILYDPAEIGQPGRPRWVLAHAHPIIDEDGKVREVMLIHEDVTERMEKEQALRTSEHKLKQLANNIPNMAWMVDPDGTVNWYNDRWYAYTGMPRDAGDEWRREHVHHPDDLAAIAEAWQHSLDTGEPFQITSLMRGRDGVYRPFITLMAPLKDEQGRVVQWFGSNTDVSALQETQDELRRVLEALRESDRRKDEFLAMLAHELRNPLAPISSAAELLCMPGLDPQSIRKASDIIARQVKHMTQLLGDLLDVSRVTRGLVQLEMETLDLKSVIASAIEQVRPLVEARRHSLTTWTGAEHLSVRGDRTRLIQVLVNLLNNAAKYTAPGGLIELKAEAREGQVRLSVRDNGMGIEAALVPQVFDLFIQASRTPDRSQGGLGIGLPLVKSIVALHKGSVEAASEGPGKGSVFTLSLPLFDDGAAEAGPDSAVSTQSPRPLRILVVDDNLDAANSLAALLELQGHRVSVAEDARSALARAGTNPPEALILDIGLPDMDGFMLARKLRERPELAGALFIALTGYGQPQDRAQSKAAGFDHHFVKPVDQQELSRVLNKGIPKRA